MYYSAKVTNMRIKRETTSDNRFIQTDILSGIRNLERLSQQQLEVKNIVNEINTRPTIIIISSDEDSDEEENFPARKEGRKLAFPLPCSDDENDDNQDNTNAEKSKEVLSLDKNASVAENLQEVDKTVNNNLSTSHISNASDMQRRQSINILQNMVISTRRVIKANSKNEETQNHSKNKEKIEVNCNSSIDKNLTTPGTSRTSPKSVQPPPTPPQSRGMIKKQEKKQINPSFLKIMNGLISTVSESRYLSGILNEEETKILEAVAMIRREYQYVCFKLYMWSPNWYNLFSFCEKLNCSLNDTEIMELFDFMDRNNIIETDWRNEDLVVLLNLLHIKHVQDICLDLHLPRKTKTKKDMIVSLLNYCNKQTTITFSKSAKDVVMERIGKKLGKFVVKIKEAYRNAFYHTYLLSTFTNPKFQDKTQYLRSIQELDFPDYTIQDHIIFYTRQDFVSYADACRFQETFETLSISRDHYRMFQLGKEVIAILRSIQQNDKEDNRFQKVPHLKRFTALAIYTRLLTKISTHLKTRYFEQVECWLKYLIKKFPKSRFLGSWYSDLYGITLRQLKSPETAATYIIEALKNKKDYLTEVQIQDLGEKGEQLKNLKSISQLYHDSLVEVLPVVVELGDFPQVTIDAQTVRGNTFGKKRHYMVQGTDGSKTFKYVEQTALDFYEKCGYTGGKHCEGSIIMATFALFFWDIIYNPEMVVPGVFLSKVQQYPLDMYTTYFYLNRKAIIDKRLTDLAENWSDEKIVEFVTENWTYYSHKAGICNIDSIIPNKEFLGIIVKCVGRKMLSDIYRRLVKDLNQYRSGMPDLLVWNEQEKKAKFVEVKGENDKLSVKQKLWLNYLKSIGTNIEVCHVHSIGSKKKLKPKLKQQKSTATIVAGSSKAVTSKKPDEPQGTVSDNASESFSDTPMSSSPKKKRRDSGNSLDYFETPPTSPLPKKTSTTKKLKSSVSVKKNVISNNATASPQKRRKMEQKCVNDTFKKSKLSLLINCKEKSTITKETIVESTDSSRILTNDEQNCSQNSQVSVDSQSQTEEDEHSFNSTESKMTQTDEFRVKFGNKENLVALKPINSKITKVTTYRRLF